MLAGLAARARREQDGERGAGEGAEHEGEQDSGRAAVLRSPRALRAPAPRERVRGARETSFPPRAGRQRRPARGGGRAHVLPVRRAPVEHAQRRLRDDGEVVHRHLEVVLEHVDQGAHVALQRDDRRLGDGLVPARQLAERLERTEREAGPGTEARPVARRAHEAAAEQEDAGRRLALAPQHGAGLEAHLGHRAASSASAVIELRRKTAIRRRKRMRSTRSMSPPRAPRRGTPRCPPSGRAGGGSAGRSRGGWSRAGCGGGSGSGPRAPRTPRPRRARASASPRRRPPASRAGRGPTGRGRPRPPPGPTRPTGEPAPGVPSEPLRPRSAPRPPARPRGTRPRPSGRSARRRRPPGPRPRRSAAPTASGPA